MNTQYKEIWDNPSSKQLSAVLAAMSDIEDIQLFLRDVMTQKEILEVGSRLEAARMLDQRVKYTDIIEKTSLSSRTVARISSWMKNGCNGYKVALEIIKSEHSHISPVNAE